MGESEGPQAVHPGGGHPLELSGGVCLSHSGIHERHLPPLSPPEHRIHPREHPPRDHSQTVGGSEGAPHKAEDESQRALPLSDHVRWGRQHQDQSRNQQNPPGENLHEADESGQTAAVPLLQQSQDWTANSKLE